MVTKSVCAEGEAYVRGACEKLKYVSDCYGSHHGQTDCTLALMTERSWHVKPGLEERELIGHIDYSLYDGRVHVSMVEVETPYRRQGWGTKMVQYLLEEEHKPISWGLATEEGSKFIKSLRRHR